MEILQRDRILTKLFPSDLAIIINLYMSDYIVPNNINHCDANIDFYTKYKMDVQCKLYTDDLKKHLSKFDEYPELQNLTKHMHIVFWKRTEDDGCLMKRAEIKTCDLRLVRRERRLFHNTQIWYHVECGAKFNNYNHIRHVEDFMYDMLKFKYVSPYIFREYITSICDLMAS